MAYQLEFTAQNKGELEEKLLTWGKVAPERDKRRGKQTPLERFILNRFLICQLKSLGLVFPITVMKGENPDFMILAGNKMVGIEVVEGCDQLEQQNWTKWHKEAGDNVRSINLMNPDRPRLFSKIINDTIAKKCDKASLHCDDLLIYSNTDSDSFEDADWKLTTLSSLPECMDKFSKVWLLSGTDLIELRERKVHARDVTDLYG